MNHNEIVSNERKIAENSRGNTHKITPMSVANLPGEPNLIYR